jgi:phage gp46-like protein
MFDVATRPQPSNDSAAAFGMPFDWRLTAPTAPEAYPYTNYVTPTAEPASGVSMLATYALELEDSLATAVIISLFTDRRAGPDDVLPAGCTDARGWLGAELMQDGYAEPDDWGSTLWLLYAGKVTPDVLSRAQYAAQQALGWLVRDGIAIKVEVQALWAGPRADVLAIRPTIYQPDRPSPVYDVLWGTSLRRWTTL